MQTSLALDTANRVALEILSSLTGMEALHHIADAARTLAKARYAALGVARTDGPGLLEFVTVGLTPEEEKRIGPRPKGAGVLGLLLERTEPLRVDTLGDHLQSVGFPPNHPPMSSFLGVPIRRGDEVMGSLYLTEKEGGGAFTAEDEAAVQTLGAYAAVAIHNLRLIIRQRALVRGLIFAQEEERRSIAFDLHDGLTQFIMASQAHMEAFRRATADGKLERAERELEQGLSYLKEAVGESRRLVSGLRTLALDDLGLAGALEQLLAEEKERSGWAVAAYVQSVTGKRYSRDLETTVYRVAQEALTNARKHAKATHLVIALHEEIDSPHSSFRLRLEIEDNGVGFAPEKASRMEGHVGLHSMEERTRLLNGVFSIRSRTGGGATICALFPIPLPEKLSQESATT